MALLVTAYETTTGKWYFQKVGSAQLSPQALDIIALFAPNLFAGGSGLAVFADGFWSGSAALGKFGAGLFTADTTGRAKFANAFLVSGLVAAGAIGGGHIRDQNILSGKYAPQSIRTADLGLGQVVSALIGANVIATPHIQAGAILSASLGPSAIGTPHIAPGAILSGLIGALQVGDPHLISGLTADKLIGTIPALPLSGRSLADLGSRAHSLLTSIGADDHHIQFTSGFHSFPHPSALIQDGAILSGAIGAGAIGTPHIAPGAILSGLIAAGAIGGGHIRDQNILSGKYAAQSIRTADIGNAQILSALIGGNVLATPHIQNQGILSASLGANIIGTPHIQNQGILSASLGPSAIGTPHIALGAILSGKVASGSQYAGIIGADRFGLPRMPYGASGYVLTGQGEGLDPAYGGDVELGASKLKFTDVEVSRLAANILGLGAGDSFRVPSDGYLQFGISNVNLRYRQIDYGGGNLRQFIFINLGGDPPIGDGLSIWDAAEADYEGYPPLRPDTGTHYTFSVYGDLLVGDIFVILDSPVQIARRQDILTTVVPTVFFSNRYINTDAQGGAGVSLYSDADPSGANDDAGSIRITAYGRGTGARANTIGLYTRSGVGTALERVRINDAGLTLLGAYGIDEAKSIRIQHDTVDDNLVDQYSIEVGPVAAWTTVKTISPSGVAGSYVAGIVEAFVGGDTGGIGDGVLVSRWRFHIANAAPTVAVLGTDVSWESAAGAAPQFRLSVSGNNILVQVQSGDGEADMYGTIHLRIFCPQFAGTSRTYTIS